MAEYAREKAICPDCNHPVSKCSDPFKPWYAFRRICWATVERETAIATMKAVRGQNANFHDGTFTKWAKEWSTQYRVPAGAGETVGVAEVDLAPWDEFTTKRDASPVPPELRPVSDDEADAETDSDAE